MLPSTHCSAARSCGGVRSNSLSRDDISVTLTSTPPCRPRVHIYLTAPTVWVLSRAYAKAAVEGPVDGLCIHAEVAVHSTCGQHVDFRAAREDDHHELRKCRPPPVS
ncbi:hypothetical protein Airi02_057800 [Actinoallomurus iriomotensis]|uniref:Uncharacterized protein n=1 Tax=Actinoallomurus iriomotensis TaxID=478107 RepID=A0A9W6S3F0_9ACTN|nr:hypothetical protein Airi02_057800 [Actinoallomurus iriomotensis]